MHMSSHSLTTIVTHNKQLFCDQASKDVLAMASLEVDLSKIEPSQTITVKWRGKPVFIKRRTEADIEEANKVNLKELRDPQKDAERVQKPEASISASLDCAMKFI